MCQILITDFIKQVHYFTETRKNEKNPYEHNYNTSGRLAFSNFTGFLSNKKRNLTGQQ